MWLKMAGHIWKWIKMANGWKWMDIDGNGQEWLEMAENCLK